MLLGTPGAVLKGAIAQVKLSYRTVIVVANFQVARDPATKAWTLTGAAASVDRVLLTERPLRFVVATNKGAWTWPVESVTVDGGKVSARLGAPS